MGNENLNKGIDQGLQELLPKIKEEARGILAPQLQQELAEKDRLEKTRIDKIIKGQRTTREMQADVQYQREENPDARKKMQTQTQTRAPRPQSSDPESAVQEGVKNAAMKWILGAIAGSLAAIGTLIAATDTGTDTPSPASPPSITAPAV